jgi:ATP-dependent Clp protease ATP-binding subunit ClpC
MTSNAGAQKLSMAKPLGFASDSASELKNRKDQVLAEIKHIFRPEFLNRVDETLVFDPLGAKELEQIADNMLAELNNRMKANGLEIELVPSAKELLLEEGSDVKYGARPLRRALRKLVEDPVSDLFLAGKFSKGDKIIAEVGEGKELKFSKAVEAEHFILEMPISFEEPVYVAGGDAYGED